MKIRHRYIPFHTRLEPAPGQRDAKVDASRDSVGKVFENDLIVDVGGRCRGYRGESLWVIDHHFHRVDDNFPSAAAAVLHLAPELAAAFKGKEEVWIATHSEPDFDAFCASYFARTLLLGDLAADASGWKAIGLRPDGWRNFDPLPRETEGRRRIDWFAPSVPDGEIRWAVLLAAYASCIDQGKPIRCERAQSLHAVLYAGQVRGRGFHQDGAAFFFELVREAVEKHGLNPLFDPVFDPEGPFAPELALLSHEGARYARDLGRARRAVVSVPVSRRPFQDWFDPLSDQGDADAPPALLGEPGVDLRVNPDHLARVGADEHRIVDALYLRDPESLLFKEWARQDHEHSPMGQGFIFTAIAHSNGKPGAKRGNSTDYYFSLDPEKADGAHLYHLWLALQREEIEARKKAGQEGVGLGGARKNFKARAGDLAGWFADPWFDGHNYKATIVPTPNDGSALESGRRGDLLDDPAAAVAMRMLEYGVFSGASDGGEPVAEMVDFACLPGGAEVSRRVWVKDAVDAALCAGCLRFVRAELRQGIDLEAPGTAEQIGRLLWPFLEPEGVRGVPSDFRESHLCVHPGSIVVWNRRGAAIAGFGKASSDVAARALRDDLRELAKVTGQIRALVNLHAKETHQARALIEDGQDLLRRLAILRLGAAVPEKRAFREILRRSGCDDSVSVVHALNVRAAEEEEGRRDKDLQVLVAGASLTIGVPSVALAALGAIGKDAFAGRFPEMPGFIGTLADWLRIGDAGHWGQFVLGVGLLSVVAGTGLWLIWMGLLSSREKRERRPCAFDSPGDDRIAGSSQEPGGVRTDPRKSG